MFRYSGAAVIRFVGAILIAISIIAAPVYAEPTRMSERHSAPPSLSKSAGLDLTKLVTMSKCKNGEKHSHTACQTSCCDVGCSSMLGLVEADQQNFIIAISSHELIGERELSSLSTSGLTRPPRN